MASNLDVKVEFGGRVPQEEYEKFREAFPQYGATNWFINAALRRFNEMIEANPGYKTLVDQSIDTMLDESFGTVREEPAT